jgi:hypothetical protein
MKCGGPMSENAIAFCQSCSLGILERSFPGGIEFHKEEIEADFQMVAEDVRIQTTIARLDWKPISE